jgi:hypothetical protein
MRLPNVVPERTIRALATGDTIAPPPLGYHTLGTRGIQNKILELDRMALPFVYPIGARAPESIARHARAEAFARHCPDACGRAEKGHG